MIMDNFFSPIPRNASFTFTQGEVELQRLGLSLTNALSFQDEIHLFMEQTDLAESPEGIPVLTFENIGYKDEEYGLNVKEDGVAILASCGKGAHLALECLREMFVAYDGTIPCFSLRDKPFFSHRGLLLDVARHFLPMDYLMKLVDAMSLLRLNVLHLHLTDDQGWRLDIPSFPEIAKIGGSRRSPVNGQPPTKSLFYSEDEMKALIAHAARRHIEIVPEIDMPGHMLSLLASHPELGCKDRVYEVETLWGIFEDVLCPAKEKTYELLEKIIAYVSELFPSRRMHIGGDECPTTSWRKCPDCQKMMMDLGLQDERKLQGIFSSRISEIMGRYGLSPIAWQEAADGDPEIKPVLSVWFDSSRTAEYSRKGYDMLLSVHDDGAYLNYSPDTDIDSGPLYGTNTLEKCYFMHTDLPAPGPGRIVGGEAALWSEYITFPFEASHFLFPRLAAVSEALWSGNGKRDFYGFLKNAGFLEKLLENVGIYVKIVLKLQ